MNNPNGTSASLILFGEAWNSDQALKVRDSASQILESEASWTSLVNTPDVPVLYSQCEFPYIARKERTLSC